MPSAPAPVAATPAPQARAAGISDAALAAQQRASSVQANGLGATIVTEGGRLGGIGNTGAGRGATVLGGTA
jgi:hypothetical protein